MAKQYIGNLGKTENGIVSLNAYALVNGLTYPLLFKIFKPRQRLKAGDEYKTKPQIAVEILQELKPYGFTIELVLADSLYGESGDVTGEISKQQLPYIVAIRSNHPVLIPKGWKTNLKMDAIGATCPKTCHLTLPSIGTTSSGEPQV